MLKGNSRKKRVPAEVVLRLGEIAVKSEAVVSFSRCLT
jgi:hypothetical protein